MKKPVEIKKLHKKRKQTIKERQSSARKWMITILLILLAAIFLTPVILTITNSFMTNTEINANYGAIFATEKNGAKSFILEKVNLKFIPDMVSFQQIKTVLLKSPKYLLKFWNSVILVVPIVIFQLFVACLASYGFSRYKGKLRALIFFLYTILMLMPYQVTLVPNYLVSDYLGLLDSYWAIWLPGIFSPFAVFLLTRNLKRIPMSIYEAAKIDGASEFQIFWHICMPIIKGAIIAVAILIFIDYWNMVEQPLIMLSNAERYPLSVFLSKINEGEIGIAFATATINMIPCLLIFLYGEKYLVEGITSQGGLKG
jgi:multiple sugar transport system permease protein